MNGVGARRTVVLNVSEASTFSLYQNVMKDVIDNLRQDLKASGKDEEEIQSQLDSFAHLWTVEYNKLVADAAKAARERAEMAFRQTSSGAAAAAPSQSPQPQQPLQQQQQQTRLSQGHVQTSAQYPAYPAINNEMQAGPPRVNLYASNIRAGQTYAAVPSPFAPSIAGMPSPGTASTFSHAGAAPAAAGTGAGSGEGANTGARRVPQFDGSGDQPPLKKTKRANAAATEPVAATAIAADADADAAADAREVVEAGTFTDSDEDEEDDEDAHQDAGAESKEAEASKIQHENATEHPAASRPGEAEVADDSKSVEREAVSGSELSESEEDSNDTDPKHKGNVCLCVYTKVKRTRDRYTCTLEKGIVRIDQHEYAFSSADASFDWAKS